VLSPGIQLSVQDFGWRGFRDVGLAGAGALDRASLRIANALVGNATDAAALELTWGPVRLRTHVDVVVALVGMSSTLCWNAQSALSGQACALAAGDELLVRAASSGARAVLAVAGGIEVPSVSGARATHLQAGFGGFAGRALKAGDRLPLGARQGNPALGRAKLNWLYPERPLRLMRVRDERLLSQSFRVDAASDRMGLRLLPNTPMSTASTLEHSVAIWPGMVQLPPSGKPILLLRDCQTTGGYPVCAQLIEADLDRAAQLRPHQQLEFEQVSLEQAIAIDSRREAAIQRLLASIADHAC
jgi:biotin-dependent carboxylase-like uncharacterized protein